MCVCNTIFPSFQVATGNSILTELTKTELSKKVGHFGFEVVYQSKESGEP